MRVLACKDLRLIHELLIVQIGYFEELILGDFLFIARVSNILLLFDPPNIHSLIIIALS